MLSITALGSSFLVDVSVKLGCVLGVLPPEIFNFSKSYVGHNARLM